MHEFFRGWKRKTGCAALGLACACMVLWIRSGFVHDSLDSPIGQQSAAGILSADQQIGFYVVTNGDSFRQPPRPQWTSFKFERFESLFPAGSGFSWEWRYGAFGKKRDQSGNVSLWVCPYCSVVIPLIGLDGWMLLSKPRPTKQTAG